MPSTLKAVLFAALLRNNYDLSAWPAIRSGFSDDAREYIEAQVAKLPAPSQRVRTYIPIPMSSRLAHLALIVLALPHAVDALEKYEASSLANEYHDPIGLVARLQRHIDSMHNCMFITLFQSSGYGKVRALVRHHHHHHHRQLYNGVVL